MAMLVVGGFMVVASTLSHASAATSKGFNPAGATLYDASTNDVLTQGGSAQKFTLGLPTTTSIADCSGDSATKGFKVWSYVIPAPNTSASVPATATQIDTAVSSIDFLNGLGTKYYALVNASGPYGPVDTAVNTGQITSVPLDFTWDALAQVLGGGPALLAHAGPGGVYEVGLACTDVTHKVTDFWNVAVTFKSSAADPDGFVWTTSGPGSTAPTTTTTTRPTTTSTTLAASTTTTAPASTTTTTVDPGTTTTVAPGAPADPGSDTGDATPVAAAGAGAGGATSSMQSTLADTGQPLRAELNVGVVLLGLGLFLIVVVPRKSRPRPTDQA